MVKHQFVSWLLLPIQLPAVVPGKVVNDSPVVWPSITQVGNLDGDSGSRLWPGLALDVANICKVNQQIKYLLLFLPSFTLTNFTSLSICMLCPYLYIT